MLPAFPSGHFLNPTLRQEARDPRPAVVEIPRLLPSNHPASQLGAGRVRVPRCVQVVPEREEHGNLTLRQRRQDLQIRLQAGVLHRPGRDVPQRGLRHWNISANVPCDIRRAANSQYASSTSMPIDLMP